MAKKHKGQYRNKYLGGKGRIINYPEKQRKPKLHRPPGVSIQPLPDIKPMILCGDNDNFDIIEQHEKVNIEKHMISDETNIPASVNNKIGKIWTGIKKVFHKEPPTAIALTKRTEMDGRTLGDTYKHYGPVTVIAGIIIIYLLTKGK